MSTQTVALKKTVKLNGENKICSAEDFLNTYSDFKALKSFEKKYLAALPPIRFSADGNDSASYKWIKISDETKTETDYPNDGPVLRNIRKTEYLCKKLGLRLDILSTSYPGFPIAEYEASLVNISDTPSLSIRDVRIFDAVVSNAENPVLHYTTGATHTGNKDQFVPREALLNPEKGGKTAMHFEVHDGKPTGEMLPYFNIEANESADGVMAILSWQGSWRADFRKTDEGLTLRCGQYEADFSLLANESFRLPMMTFLFYRGDWVDGQNIFRRFMTAHNHLRAQGIRMDKNVLVCVGDDFPGMKGNAKSDLDWIDKYKKAGLTDKINYFNQDAGWYDCMDCGWEKTGNWTPDTERYPNGLIEVSDAARKEGMMYSLWFEPERAYTGTKIVKELGSEGIVTLDKRREKMLDPETAPANNTSLVYYGAPGVVDYVFNTINKVITEQGVDQYRQDFNFDPQPYYRAHDLAESEKLGLPRTGIAENKHTTGVLELFDRLVKAHPDLVIDACASGGMRHDLKTHRYSFTHTVTDYWQDQDESQCLAYTRGLFWTKTGGGAVLDYSSDYDVRSRLHISVGLLLDPEHPEITRDFLRKWEENQKYIGYDYYPLTSYSKEKDAILSLQYNSPEKGCGSIFTYIRKSGEMTVYPRGLDPDAKYKLRNIDEKKAIICTGADLMKNGLTVCAESRSAIIHRYEKLAD